MALSVDRKSASGETTGTVALDESFFGIQPNVPVLHQVVTAQLAAARAGTQSTKTRAEVAGGGKKPFKQKGTGRARQGSERAPHFTGGGVALGPKPRSYRQKTPRKMIQLALKSALSDRASDGKVVVVDPWPWEEPSTRAATAALKALELDGRVLIVLSREDEDAYKSFRNLPDVQLMLRGELNAYDILCNDWIVFTPETLPGGGEAGTASAAGSAGQPAAKAAPSPAATSTVAGEADEVDADESVAPATGGEDAEEPDGGDELESEEEGSE